MKVLYVCEYPTLNGGENSLLSILPLLTEHDVTPLVAAPKQGDLSKAVKSIGVELIDFDQQPADGPLPRAEKLAKLSQIIRSVRPDIVHANSVSMSRLTGVIRTDASVPSVGHLRDIIKLSRRSAVGIASNDRLIAVSNATQRHFHGLGIANIEVIYNGVDLERFCPEPRLNLAPLNGLADDSPIVLIIGQIGIRKGLDMALEAVAQVVSDFPGIQVWVVGERHSQKQEAIDYERRCHDIANRFPLSGRVHFLGRRSDVDKLLKQADLLLHMARQEPLGRVLLEAGASGCCIVSTDVGGTSEIIPPDVMQNCLVPPDNVAQSAKLLRQLLSDPDRRSAVAGQIAAYVRATFDRRVTAARTARLYASLQR